MPLRPLRLIPVRVHEIPHLYIVDETFDSYMYHDTDPGTVKSFYSQARTRQDRCRVRFVLAACVRAVNSSKPPSSPSTRNTERLLPR